MKKVLSVTIALCLVFGSILPVYADPWTNTQADSVTRDVNSIKTYLQSFTSSWTTFFETGQGTISTLLTFQDLMRDIVAMGDWLAPMFEYAGGLRPESMMSVWDTLTSTLSSIVTTQSIIQNINNTLVTNGTTLGSPKFVYRQNFVPYSTPVEYSINSTSLSILNRGADGQVQVGWPNRNPASLRQLLLIMANNNMLQFSSIFSIGTKYIRPAYEKFTGTELTTQNAYTYLSLMDLMFDSVDSIHLIDKLYWHTLQHYGDRLSTWDSQGDTLEQVEFTPDSAIQGLYRYLAFTQRDVARLTYVMASDEEITAREKARETQTAVMDNFIDPESDSSVTDTDIGGMSDLASGFKDNFSTGQSAGNVFSIFNNGSSTNWFSTATKNALDTTLTRSFRSAGSSTPLLDAYYEEIMTYFPGGDQE